MSFNPYQAYQAASVTGRSALELVIMLFEGLVKNLEAAKEHICAQDVEGAHVTLVKAQRIVTHLIPAVNDEGGEASAKLKGLYFFCLEKIVSANFKKSEQDIDDALRVIVILQDTWNELQTQKRAQARGAAAGAAPAGGEPTSHAVA